MKRIKTVIISVFAVIISGVSFFFVLDNDKSLTLPLTQKIKTVSHIANTLSNQSFLDHIVIITMENKSYNDIVGSQNAPYLNSLIHKYGFAANYFAISHPSLPNYIALIGGSMFGIKSDCTDCYITATNLVDQLEQAHKIWKAYMESMPNSCYIGSAGNYAQKHNPFIYFDDIRNTKNRCQNIVPFNQLQSDFKSIDTTPNFVWISPNLCDDMHNCSVATGDSWLASQVPVILQSPAFTKQKSLLVITWDEGEGSSSNQVPTIFIGNSVRQGFVSHVAYTHYSLLKTIEKMWNLPPLTTNVLNSNLINDIFR